MQAVFKHSDVQPSHYLETVFGVSLMAPQCLTLFSLPLHFALRRNMLPLLRSWFWLVSYLEPAPLYAWVHRLMISEIWITLTSWLPAWWYRWWWLPLMWTGCNWIDWELASRYGPLVSVHKQHDKWASNTMKPNELQTPNSKPPSDDALMLSPVQVQLQVWENQLVLNQLPDDPSHLISLHLHHGSGLNLLRHLSRNTDAGGKTKKQEICSLKYI